MNIISAHRAQLALVALITMLTGSAFGYWSYSEYRQRDLQNQVLALMEDASVRLRGAFVLEGGVTALQQPEALKTYYEHAVVVDGHLQKLRAFDLSTLGALGEAADDYLLTSREILLRRASSQRYRLKLAGDLEALRNHMRSDNRTGAWVTEAVRARERVEEDHRDLRIASNALGTLLDSFPAAQARIAPHVEASLLIEDRILLDARERVTAMTREVARDLDRYANLNNYR